MCSARRRKGPAICPHELAFSIEETDDLILSAIESVVLSTNFIEDLLDSALTVDPVNRSELKTTRRQLLDEIANFNEAVAEGGDIPSLVASLEQRERQLAEVDTQLALAPREPPDRQELRSALTLRVNEWRDILRGHIPQARRVLTELIELPITVNADPQPEWMTRLRAEGLLDELAGHPDWAVAWREKWSSGTNLVSPTGFLRHVRVALPRSA